MVYISQIVNGCLAAVYCLYGSILSQQQSKLKTRNRIHFQLANKHTNTTLLNCPSSRHSCSTIANLLYRDSCSTN